MGETRRRYKSLKNYQFSLGYFHKSKRGRMKKITRNTYHSLRNMNKTADQINFTPSRYEKIRNFRYHKFQKIGEIYSQRYRLQDIVQDYQLRKYTSSPSLAGKIMNYIKSEKLSNTTIFEAAYKQLKRRGSLKPFKGHIKIKQLQKYNFLWNY